MSAEETRDGADGADGGPVRPSGEAAGGASGASSPQGEPTEEQLRAAYEEELSRITATDVIAQASVSLLNIGARRLAPPGGETSDARDLEQVRDAIDAVRALLEILERRVPQELGPLRDALSRLQMTYAREIAPGAGGAEASGTGAPAAGSPSPAGAEQRPAGEQPPSGVSPPGPGPAESSGRLWVPGR